MKTSLIIFTACLFFVSCTEKPKRDNSENARKLFAESVSTINEFCRDLANASDSLQVDSLVNQFDNKIANINFSYPPLTDLDLTEQENDSIHKLLIEFQECKNQRLIYLHRQYSEKTKEPEEN